MAHHRKNAIDDTPSPMLGCARVRRRRDFNEMGLRIVPGFSVQANRQKGTVTEGPARKKLGTRYAGTRTAFSVNYGRPGFLVVADHAARHTDPPFRWLVPLDLVDYVAYVPILADGLRERPWPYGECALRALWDLLARDETGDRVLAALPHTVEPLRRALDAGPRDWTAVVRVLLTLQRLAAVGRDGRVGRALVPYYRHLLRPVDTYCRGRVARVRASNGLRAGVTYNVGDLCADTLATLERYGGHCAFVNIKYVVPTYESGMGGLVRCCTESDGENRRYSPPAAPCSSPNSGATCP